MTGAHNFKFGTNMRFQRHNDIRGSVSGVNATPYINFDTGINTVDPATFGIPGDINIAFDRPALRAEHQLHARACRADPTGLRVAGQRYGPGGTLFDFIANYPEIDFFAQDSWRVKPNLTMDLGVRWELKLHPNNPDSLIRAPSSRVAAGEGGTSSLVWVEEPIYSNDLNNVAPSLGLAWDPAGDGKSSIRGNYRMAFDRIATQLISSQIYQSIPGITLGVTNTAYGQAGGRLPGIPGLSPRRPRTPRSRRRPCRPTACA